MFEFPPPTAGPQPLDNALRQLSAEPAPFDDWTRMRRRLHRHAAGQRRQHWRDLALAAGLLLGIALALVLAPRPAADTPQTVRVAAPSLDELQAESAWLESWLQQQRRSPPARLAGLDAERMAARQELLAQLQFVDALLADRPAADIEHALWQRRVLLLRQLSVELSPSGTLLSSTTGAEPLLL